VAAGLIEKAEEHPHLLYVEAGYAAVANMHSGQDEALRAWAEAQGPLGYIGRENERLG
jgi:hypothetical protein